MQYLIFEFNSPSTHSVILLWTLVWSFPYFYLLFFIFRWLYKHLWMWILYKNASVYRQKVDKIGYSFWFSMLNLLWGAWVSSDSDWKWHYHLTRTLRPFYFEKCNPNQFCVSHISSFHTEILSNPDSYTSFASIVSENPFEISHLK